MKTSVSDPQQKNEGKVNFNAPMWADELYWHVSANSEQDYAEDRAARFARSTI